MSNTTGPTNSIGHGNIIIEELESFLYTPIGLGTLAGVSVLVTSLIWLLFCCICCCCWRKCRRSEDGTQEADRELHFIDPPRVSSSHNAGGTMSSGYNTGPASYSMTSLLTSTNNLVLESSMDSVVHVET